MEVDGEGADHNADDGEEEEEHEDDANGDRSEFITIKMSSPSSPADENENEIR